MRHTTMAPAPQSHKFALKVGKPFPIVQTNPPRRFRNRVDSPVNWFAGSTIEPSNRRVCLPGAALPTMTAKVPPHISSSVGIQSQARFFPCFVPAFPLEFRGTGESSREDSAARIEFAKPCSGTPQVVVALAAGDLDACSDRRVDTWVSDISALQRWRSRRRRWRRRMS